jgi:hypothetical protein
LFTIVYFYGYIYLLTVSVPSFHFRFSHFLAFLTVVYDGSMRHFLLILLIAFLPLRGWASISMVYAVPGQAATVVNTVVSAHCAEMGDASTALRTDVDKTPTPHPGCGHCQLCHALGLATEATVAVHPLLPQTPVAHATSRFTSALTATSFKPPRV